MNIKKLVWFSLILAFLINACQLSSSRNVETIVKENNLTYWHLSPNGDYLVYGSPRGKNNFLLNLATGQEHEFNCELLWWDNYHIGCHKPREVSIVDVKNLVEVPLIPLDLNKKSNGVRPKESNETHVNELLEKAEKIYRPDWLTDTIYILAPNYQLNLEENYIVSGLIKPDQLLAKYTVISFTISLPPDRIDEKTFSPNNLYYYDFPMGVFTVFTTDKNKKIAEFLPKQVEDIDVLGWAPDSSGVYFITYRNGIGMAKEIRKLTIPDE